MRHNKKGRKLGRNATHKRAMIKNIATSLFRYGSIRTTLPKAKETRPYAEKLITRAISGTLADKRIIIQRLNDRSVAHHLINDIAPEFKKRNGGYLRIIKLGNRDGDGAEMAVLEIVSETVERKRKSRSERKKKAAEKHDAEAKKAAATTEEGETGEEKVDSETQHEHEKTHHRDEQTKEHLTHGSKAEGSRKSSKPPKSVPKQSQLHRGTSTPKTPPPSSQEN
ncbi:50S ribosomal protein L17 [bacterium]|nr:MAG: 50S ribosomal protein L17 [bacterium]